MPTRLQDAIREISIHALREEGDRFLLDPLEGENISIHALREEGDIVEDALSAHARKFLSTPSVRRATGRFLRFVTYFVISIHALREEGDSSGPSLTSPLEVFLSTPSARRATS